MKRNKFFKLHLFLLVMITTSLDAQTLKEQIELQNLYSTQLSISRGVQQLVQREVNEESIKEVLQRFTKTGILIYTHISDTLLVTLINRKGVVLGKKIPISEEDLVNQVNNVNEYISGSFSSQPIVNRGSVVVSENRKKTTLKKAYDNLNDILLPFKEDLKKLDHLIIVPSLNIATLPFAAFKFSEQTYLIDLMSYSISPSLYEVAVSNNVNNLGKYQNQSGRSLFVSNPDFTLLKEESFPALPGTTQETDYITKSLNKNSFLLLEGKNATKSNILKDIREYDLLYFATHGVANNEDALDKSYLVVSGNNESDSYLTAREIQDLRFNHQLRAKLVVLSACQTGLGKIHNGGVIGLARAFQIAGAKHVMMSLWSVNDKETATLMSMFFDELKKGGKMKPHGALRNAILKYKEVNDDPKYWASFSLFGIPNENFDDIDQKLQEYTEAAIFENINFINNDNLFKFKLLPIEYNIETETAGTLLPEDAYLNKSGVFQVNTKDSHAVLQVINKSERPIYFSIIEINSKGEINSFMPNNAFILNDNERKIAPGETKIFKDYVYSFGPPYERLILKAFATFLPFDLTQNKETEVKNKIDGYTAEFVYEIVR